MYRGVYWNKNEGNEMRYCDKRVQEKETDRLDNGGSERLSFMLSSTFLRLGRR